MDKSIELNGADAIGYIGRIEDAAGVKEFIEGDTRKGVLAAAEKRIAALAPASEGMDGENPVVTEQPEQGGESKDSSTQSTTIQSCSWMYHKDHEPRIFKAGESAPCGWTSSPKDIVGKIWIQDISGKWERVIL